MCFSAFLLLLSKCVCEIDVSDSGKKNALPLTEKIFYKDFLNSYNYYNKYQISPKKITQASLAYVTPWNSKGYDIAKLFAVKFSHISPVWLRLPPSEGCTVEGLHDIDSSWMSAVRGANQDVKILPRLIFDGWTETNYQKLFRTSGAQSTCISAILPVLKKYKFDGIVLEIWMQHSGTSHEELMLFIRRLSRSLHDDQMSIVLAIPPPVYQGGYTGSFVREHFNFLSSDVDFFSLMTYDYSNPYMPGPNSPIKWVRECVELLAPSGSKSDLRSKILVGLNFYGYDLVPNQRSGRPVLGHEDSSGHEHVVYFPSAFSIARRISLVQELGTGISIWEIGQGLDSFYEQL
ncbi:unnamed protein product [Dibothriocephalus latus]|uniref:Chitinase domain-containing protein 1 n=1 Tax=Dibothriocephalus latus TaxID=60516 RepID=A0A3P7LC68_DIBLA|nr:unnamed protein product [Dibothriocephalus latus]